MTKILIWIVVVFAVLFALRLLGAASARRRARPKDRESSPSKNAETMVRCARCGVYLPRSDATPGPAGLVCGEPGCVQRR